MSMPINRTDTAARLLVPVDTSVNHKTGGASAFDPGTAAQKTANEEPLQVQGFHSQVLAEAMDGDASEAMMRGALGVAKREGLADDDMQVAADDVNGEAASRRPRAKPTREVKNTEQTSAQTSDRIAVAGKRGTRGVESLQGVAAKAQDVSSIADHHDQLMMLSSTMSRRDLATFLAKKHAARLETIFQGDAWTVRRDAPLKATAAQMPG